MTPPVSEVTMMNLCDGPSKVSEHGGEWCVFGVWNSQSNQHDAFTRPNFGVWTTSQSYRYTGCAAVTSFGCAAVSCSPSKQASLLVLADATL